MTTITTAQGVSGYLAAVIALAFSSPSLAAVVTQASLSEDGSQLTLNTDEGRVSLTAYGEGTLAVTYHLDGELPSFAIAEDAPLGQASLSEIDGGWRLQLPDLRAEIQAEPLRISFYRGEQLLTAEAPGLISPALDRNPSGGESWQGQTGTGFAFSLSDGEQLLGGGQRVLGMDRRGLRMPLYNKASYGYGNHAEQMYYSLPAVLSDRHYLLAFDNSASGWLDIGASEPDRLSFEAISGRQSYLISSGTDYPELIENFTATVGRQPLPPRWSLGNYASRFGYRSEAETRDVVAQFQQQDIPLDAVVLDLYWFGPDIKGHMGNLDWDRRNWPDPEGMISDFAAQGINTMIITEPFILTSSSNWQAAVEANALAVTADGQPQTFDFYFGNTGLLDVFSDAGQQWFWQAYQRLLEQGISGWWGDLGEPEVHPDGTLHQLSASNQLVRGDEIHNAYGHQWAKMVFNGLKQAQPQQRPMVMMRSGFVGSQRYGMIPWTGDVDRSWAGLQPQVQLSLQMGMLGLGFTHSDLGGFAGGEQFDSELYTRWLQYGVFQPVFRPHAQEHIAPEPIFADETTKAIVRDFIKLRYRLMPYLYSAVYQNSLTGLPLMRPLLMEDNRLFGVDDAYRFGDAMIVAPVTDKGVTQVTFDLPQGVYFDWFSGKRYQGGQRVSVPVSLTTIPVLIEAGKFVPLVADHNHAGDYSSEQLTLHYYHDDGVTEGSGQMYEDDGHDPNAIVNGRYEKLEFISQFNQQANQLRFTFSRQGGYDGMPATRQLTLRLHQVGSVAAVSVDGHPVPFTQQGNDLQLSLRWQQASLQLTLQRQ
ncbi:TIM-barrel domain-containing protein [Ferrimonas senticii]|uniref:glycoside hydrolase family 31 protein n=1 Tax=Ferrimonas senticii TaxID=394566 RepID=UPI0004068EAC|nr:TIM-barrel domain-containing protein [Ferrimonas senticii]